jgi:dTDP-6-deoxy-L-talose 4-dehydrogenase (NAD+)
MAKHPFALTWARLFYMFGEGQNESSLWSQFNRSHERGDAVFPMSGGAQLRDFLPVQDVARYLVELALSPSDCGIVNVCSGRPVSVRSLVEGWAKERGWNVSLGLGQYPNPEYEPMAYWGSNRKLAIVLNRTAGQE